MIAGILVMVTGGTKIVLFVGIGMLVLGQLITGQGLRKDIRHFRLRCTTARPGIWAICSLTRV